MRRSAYLLDCDVIVQSNTVNVRRTLQPSGRPIENMVRVAGRLPVRWLLIAWMQSAASMATLAIHQLQYRAVVLDDA